MNSAPPNCPRCGCVMVGGAPHGPWPIQWECRACGTIVVPSSRHSGAAPPPKATG